jgi:GntR family transcriptional regulator, transcriptional repressor for pyruvate dehydrogenase complex
MSGDGDAMGALVQLFGEESGRVRVGIGRASTLSARIVADVRDALAEGRLKPDSFLGTESEIAAHWGVSRIVARDALKALQALGIVEIRVGSRGGARIAAGNPALFADALGIQLDLMGVTAEEVMDAQRAIESLAAELAAEKASESDHARLRALVARSKEVIDDSRAFTELGRAFHFAVAEASKNRVLAAQLRSIHHVSWPARNPTLTPSVARHVVEVHERLSELIALRSPAEARRLMDEHVKMIAARRRAERSHASAEKPCC